MNWTQAEAVALCREIEAICPEFGCHVALTGGLLYKDGERKDLDIVFYRIRQTAIINEEGLFAALDQKLEIKLKEHFGFCVKLDQSGRRIDAFFPECDQGEYGAHEAQQEELEARV
jgi:hypothetical protein